jgi:hypothetical protein
MAAERLELARALITEKKYAEARAILVSVDHPLAVEWIAKIDQIAPPPIDRSGGAARPRIPVAAIAAGVVVVLFVVIGGAVYSQRDNIPVLAALLATATPSMTPTITLTPTITETPTITPTITDTPTAPPLQVVEATPEDLDTLAPKATSTKCIPTPDEVAVIKKFMDFADTDGNLKKSTISTLIRGMQGQYNKFRAMAHPDCLKKATAFTIAGMKYTIGAYQDWNANRSMSVNVQNSQHNFRSASNIYTLNGQIPDYRMTDSRSSLFGLH